MERNERSSIVFYNRTIIKKKEIIFITISLVGFSLLILNAFFFFIFTVGAWFLA